MSGREKRSIALSAYHDGELAWFARWRVERQLRESPEMRRELAELVKISDWVQQDHSAADALDTPDLWSEIGPLLWRVDRGFDRDRDSNNRIERKAKSNRSGESSRSQIGVLWGVLAAGGALAVLVLAATVEQRGAIPERSAPGMTHEVAKGSLRYLQTNGVTYLVSQDSPDVTIIWLVDPGQMSEGA